MDKSFSLEEIKKKLIKGEKISYNEALYLATQVDKGDLYALAEQITQKYAPKDFDICSIHNVKSGHCSEDCKWCSQSRHSKSNVDVYGVVSKEECLHVAKRNEKDGIHRFSLVASGRKPNKKELEKLCENFSYMDEHSSIKFCASLGLVNKEELEKLYISGVRRYHCNLETAPSFFNELCSTHTQEEKLQTIKWAKEVGMDICCGGIIGMGESLEQRIEFAFTLRDIQCLSIPINILQAMPGTALENVVPLSDDEILTTIALFRLINPTAYLRFAGGRSRLSRETKVKAMKIAINSCISGNLLTTIGSTVEEDKEMIKEAHYQLN